MNDQTIAIIPNWVTILLASFSSKTAVGWPVWVVYVLYDMLHVKTEARFDWKITLWTVTMRTRSV